LGLAYAETYPEHTAALVLRGIFTATAEELEHYYCGGSAYYFPETFESLQAAMPEAARCVSPDTLYRGMVSGDETLRKRYAIAWLEYEAGIAHAEPQPIDAEAGWRDENGWRRGMLSLGVLENWYMSNRCFLREGQLIEDAGRLAGIPVTLVNGRYDMICPPLFATRVHRAIPGSKLVIAELSGHSMTEPRIEAALLEAMRELE
jgi:proline iminopeptidase